VQHIGVERALHLQLALGCGDATEQHVTGARDRERRLLAEQDLRKHVGEHAFRETATVELHAGRARDDRTGPVELDALPVARRRAVRGRARRSQLEQPRQRRTRFGLVGVAGELHLLEQRAVDEPGGERAGIRDRGAQAGHRRAYRHRRAWVSVQLRQLAVGEEPREANVPFE
jgi:hypothetical protein